MISLRPYQQDAISAVRDYWREGGGNPLVEMATGTGKSVVIGNLTRDIVTEFPDMRVLMLVHVRELVQQNAMALLRSWPQAPIGINSAGLGRRDNHSQILFASIQSVFKRGRQIGPRDLVLIDEAHLVPRDGEGMYLQLLSTLRDMVPDLRVCGFTATGYRLDSGRLDEGDGRLFDETIYNYGLADAVRDGWLSPLRAKPTKTEIDVRGVARRGGEFVAGSLEAAADKEDVVEGACDEIVECGRSEGRRGWLVFCSGVAHATHVRDALRRRDVSCEMVSGDTPTGERDRIIKAYRNGQIECLTNAMVLTTGFDVPHVDLIGMLRPTLSTGLYVQICGRGTRLADGKTDCRVLDFAGNVRRHGPVDAVEVGVKKNVGKERPEKTDPDTVRAKICPVCQTYNALSASQCISCGFEWPKPEPKHSSVADDAPIMVRDVPKWIPVNDVHLDEHFKSDAPLSLRVEYLCGLQTYREWVCLEHKGFARGKAEAWWRSMNGKLPEPKTVKEAMARAGELDMPTHVAVARDGKFWRVIGCRVTRPDGRQVEIDDRYRVKPYLEAAA